LTWDSPSSDGGYPLTTYRIYRTSGEISGQLIAEIDPDSDEFTDTGLENGNTYNYYLTVLNDMGEGERSEVVSAIPLTHPSDPSDFELSSTTDTVKLKWLPPQDNGGIKIEGYLIYKGRTLSDMVLWRDLGPEESSTEDPSVNEGTYHYRIHAYNSIGASDGVDAKVNVPPRIPIAVIIGVFAFIIPLLILASVFLFPYLIRKRKEREPVEEKDREEPPSAPGLPPVSRGPHGLPSYPGIGGLPPGMGASPGPYFRPPPPTLMPPPQVGPGRVLPPAPPTPEPETDSPQVKPPEKEDMEPPEPEPVGPPEMEDIVFPPPVTPFEPAAVEESILEPPAPGPEAVYHEDEDHLWTPQMVHQRSVQESENAVHMLKELNDLKKMGAITEEEYEISKKRILRKI
jgi:hypothetical protein